MKKWGAKDTAWRRIAIARRDGNRCWLCLAGFTDPEDPATIDHAIPKSRGGTNHLANLRLAHESCNCARGNIASTAPRAAQQRLAALSLSLSL